ALLVAPADVERAGCPEALRPFAPIPTAALPFATQVVGSSNDYAASEARARELAGLWGADVAILPGAGHINVASGHHRWSEGLVWLDQLEQRLDQQRSPWQRMAS
ncbi:alpha/beta hydrolase, partial [Pokkaliibacter plantistimulans]